MTLGTRIAGARSEAGLTQQQLADAVGRSVHAVRKWERDENKPSVELLEKIAEITGAPLGFLLGHGEEEGLSEVEKTRAALARLQRRIEGLREAGGLAAPGHPGVDALADSELFRREYQVTDEELHMLRNCVITRLDGTYVSIDTIHGAIALLEAIRRLETELH